jgi:hemoglobin
VPDVTLFERLGREDGVAALVEDFYARVEADPDLRPVYPDDLAPAREKLTLFFHQWLGGPPSYSDKYGHPRLRLRHFPFVIDNRAAGRWLKHMREAMAAAGLAGDELKAVFEALAPLAKHMVNADDDVPREPLKDTYLS